jgi:hypothetical protein
MTGPWEKYQQQPAAQGPWSKYQAAPPPSEMSWGSALKSGVKNLPGSVGQYFGDTAQSFMHPVQTGSQLGHAVATDPKAVGQELIRPYTSAAEFKKTIAEDPARIMGDAAIVGGVGGAAIPGKVGRVATAASRAFDPLAWAGKGVGGVGKATGAMSGAGSNAASHAYQGAKAGRRDFVDNMTGKVPVEKVVDDYRGALEESRQRMSAQYKANKAGAFSANRQVIPFDEIAEGATNANFRYFKTQSLQSPKGTETLQRVQKIVEDWKVLDPKEYHTPEGLDALKQKIYNEVGDWDKLSREEKRIVGSVTRPIGKLIRNKAPQYAKMMDDYQKAQHDIREFEHAFSSGKRTDTALRKLQSSFRNDAYAGHGYRAQLMEDLSKRHPEIAEALAGQAMNTYWPRGLRGAISTPVNAAGAAASMFYVPWMAAPFAAGLAGSSPRLAGNVAHWAGKAARYPSMAMDAVGVTPRGVGLGAMVGSRTNRELEED